MLLLSVLRQAIDGYPPELLRIVADYGMERGWSDIPIGCPIWIDGNRLTTTPDMNAYGNWYRVVSKTPVLADPDRWTITFTLRPPCWICFGITTASTSVDLLSGTWNSAATDADFLVLTTLCSGISPQNQPIRIFHGRTVELKMPYQRKFVRSDQVCAVSIEASYRTKTMRLQFDDYDGVRQDLLLDVPAGLCRIGAVWRPAVSLVGCVSATFD